MRKWTRFGSNAAVAILAVSSVACPVEASTLLAVGLEHLVATSDAVMVARSIGSETFSDGSRLRTRHRLIVEEAVAGVRRGEAIVLVTEGGRKGSLVQKVVGEAEIAMGGRYLVFGRRFEHAFRPAAMSQGVCPVEADPRSGALLVRPALDHARLVRRTDGRIVETGPWLRAPRPLTDVLAEIRGLIGRQEGADHD